MRERERREGEDKRDGELREKRDEVALPSPSSRCSIPSLSLLLPLSPAPSPRPLPLPRSESESERAFKSGKKMKNNILPVKVSG